MAFRFTIADDAVLSDDGDGDSSDPDESGLVQSKGKKKKNSGSKMLDPSFTFEVDAPEAGVGEEEDGAAWNFMEVANTKETAGQRTNKSTLDDKIRAKLALKKKQRKQAGEEEESEESEEEEEEEEESDDDDDVERGYETRGSKGAKKKKGGEEDGEESGDGDDVADVGTVTAKGKKSFNPAADLKDSRSAAYFAASESSEGGGSRAASGAPNGAPSGSGGGGKASEAGDGSFDQLHLSRPLLRAIRAMGYVSPTPIQFKAIPVALQGRDICGSAMTGSGKTAAFCLPILERLLFRDRSTPATRVLIVMPTRELATQCQGVLNKLAQFTDIRSALIVGGLSIAMQQAELRKRPDVVVCTPGRMIDHLRNSQSVDVDDVEVLVLDEADRLLEFGFEEEVSELVRHCPAQRQTMLFSATMTENVDKLTRMSLRKPVRVSVDALFEMATRLRQEFVRIRNVSGNVHAALAQKTERERREAIVLALCARSFKTRTIVFFSQKHHAHRMALVFGLMGLRMAELHGNLTQQQRLSALQRFKDGEVDFLLATDLASRGLDIPGVETVINFEMPKVLATYIHRVGRTARAGRKGVSVTLCGEPRRHLMKEAVKRSRQNVKARSVPIEIVEKYREQVEAAEPDIRDILWEEREEKEMRVAEMEANRAANLVEFEDQIAARPQKTWFQSNAEKKHLKDASKDALDAAPTYSSMNLTGAAPEQEELDEEATRKASANAAIERKVARAKAERDKAPERDGHRMTRAKRRRREASELMNKPAEDDDGDRHANDRKADKDMGSKGIAGSISAVIRQRKRGRNEKESVVSGLAAGDLSTQEKMGDDEERQKKKKKKKKADKKDRTQRVEAAMGGDVGADKTATGFEAEMGGRDHKKGKKAAALGAGGDKKGKDPAVSKGKKQGGKPAKTGFKSKQRYKRR